MREEGGFRSSVSSSIIKVNCPGGMDSPSDQAIFERLLREKSPHYSPRFTRMGSTPPIWKPHQYAASPTMRNRHSPSSPVREQSSWQTIDSGEPSSRMVRDDDQDLPVYDNVEGIEEDGIAEQDDEQNWETLKSSPPQKARRRKSSLAKLLKSKPFSKAQRMWDQFQPKSRETSARVCAGSLNSPGSWARGSESPSSCESIVRPTIEDAEMAPELYIPHLPKSPEPLADSMGDQLASKPASPGPTTEVSGANTRSVAGTNLYPQLSVGSSSFTSHASDHGRQPDVDSDDNIRLSAGNAMESSFNDKSYRLDDTSIETDDEPVLPAGTSLIEEEYDIYDTPNYPTSEVESPEPKPTPLRNTAQMAKKRRVSFSPRKSQNPFNDDSGSDDEFPSLEVLMSQSQVDPAVKKENSASLPRASQTKADKNYERSKDLADDLLWDEDETTPKTSQKFTSQLPSRYNSRESKPRVSEARDSQGRDLHFRGSQPQSNGSLGRGSQRITTRAANIPSSGQIPSRTQVFDLTISSDAEPDADDSGDGEPDADEPELEQEERIFPKRFRKPWTEDSDDDDYDASDNRASQGWVDKKAGSLHAPTRQSSTSDSLKASSSQASTRPKRKTISRI
jgi:hypothetical protein